MTNHTDPRPTPAERRRGLVSVTALALGGSIFVGAMAAFPQALPQRPASTPSFEVASIRPCRRTLGRGSGPASPSPGRLAINCGTVKGLIEMAYLMLGDGVTARPDLALTTRIEGGPDWIATQGFTINATAAGSASSPMVRGPMLQRLLEDRFMLKLHVETRQVPVYELRVVRGGSKLTPFVEGNCVLLRPDFDNEGRGPSPLAPGQRPCDLIAGLYRGNMVVDGDGVTVDELITPFLAGAVDRPIINRTGLTGRYVVHLEFAPADGARRLPEPGGGATPDATAPALFTAIREQLGLTLDRATGPGRFIVIDHLERPTEN